VARSAARTRAARPGAAQPLILIEPDSAVCCVFFKAAACSSCPTLPSPRDVQPHVLRAAIGQLVCVLSAGCGRSARTPFGSLVRALPAKGGASCLSLVGARAA
jgi:hypothetical protein